MSALLAAAKGFEKILPHNNLQPTSIDTTFDYAFGELHRIFYDVAKLEEEDQWLVAVVKPFVQSSHMTVSSIDEAVKELRYYLVSH